MLFPTAEVRELLWGQIPPPLPPPLRPCGRAPRSPWAFERAAGLSPHALTTELAWEEGKPGETQKHRGAQTRQETGNAPSPAPPVETLFHFPVATCKQQEQLVLTATGFAGLSTSNTLFKSKSLVRGLHPFPGAAAPRSCALCSAPSREMEATGFPPRPACSPASHARCFRCFAGKTAGREK